MSSSSSTGPFKVMVANHFRYMDTSAAYEYNTYATLAEAITAAQQIVDTFLLSVWQPGMTTDELCCQYTAFGDDPYLVGSQEPLVPFSAQDYARVRCRELCGW
jgi:hypothetical protein